MKRLALVSLFLLAALLTSAVQAQAPEVYDGLWLHRILQKMDTYATNHELNEVNFADFHFTLGLIYASEHILTYQGSVCMPLPSPGVSDVSAWELAKVVDNTISKDPKRFYRADAAWIIATSLEANYPCKEGQRVKPPVR